VASLLFTSFPMALIATVCALAQGSSPRLTWLAFAMVSVELLVATIGIGEPAPLIGASLAVIAMGALGVLRLKRAPVFRDE
jgi:hypothetical protein